MYQQVHVTELFDPGGIVECTWATGLELARAALNGTPRMPPATAAEREALRVAGGGSDSGGSNYDQLAAGCQHRYGWSPALTTTFPASLPPGYFYGVQGNYHALPAHYQRWDPAFAARPLAPHSSVFYNIDGNEMWCDPLAPPSVRDPKGGTAPWVGEPITYAVVKAYFAALPGAHVAIAKINQPGPRVRVASNPFKTYTVRGGTPVAGHLVGARVVGSSSRTAPVNTVYHVDPTVLLAYSGMSLMRLLDGPYEGLWVNPHGALRYSA